MTRFGVQATGGSGDLDKDRLESKNGGVEYVMRGRCSFDVVWNGVRLKLGWMLHAYTADLAG